MPRSKNRQKNSEKCDKNKFFCFIFPIPLSYTSQPSFSIVLCTNQKLEQKTSNTHATLLWPHLRYDTWDVRKFCLLPEEISSISSLKICIFSLLNINISNLLYFIIGVIVKILFNMVCFCPRHAESPWARRRCFRCDLSGRIRRRSEQLWH